MRPFRLIPLLLLLLPLAALAADDVDTLYEAGVKAEAARDFKTAVAAYEKAIDLDEEYRDAFERWEYCQRLVSWQEGLSGAPGPADLVSLGEAWLDLGRFLDERKCYEDAIALDPANPEAHGHLALWNYTRGGDFDVVYRETLEFLEKSPNREGLAESAADFRIYGALRNLRGLLGPAVDAWQEKSGAKDHAAAAAVLEEAAKGDLPEGARLWCLYQAATSRRTGGDAEGARKGFAAVLEGTPCVLSMYARLALAEMDAAAGDLPAALGNLKAAVAEGSGACARIAKEKEGAYAPLFGPKDPEIAAAAGLLTDEEAADEPIRARIRAATERARAEGKRVLLHWYGPYCPYVMAMQARLADPAVRQRLEKSFVVVRVDQGSGHRAVALDAEYGDVMRNQGVPSFFVLDGEGSVKDVQKDIGLMGAPHRCYSAERILRWLERVAPKAE